MSRGAEASGVEPDVAIDDDEAAAVVDRGYALLTTAGGSCASLAVTVPAPPQLPIAAVALQGSLTKLAATQPDFVALLHRMAERLSQERLDVSNSRWRVPP